MDSQKLVHVAKDVVELMDKAADEVLPQEIVDVVKLHSKIAVGSAWVPIPGADVAAGAANIWTMYIRINGKLGLSFKENIMKTIGSGVATNLVSYIALSGVASALKFIPGIGTVGGAMILSASLYAVTLASGYVYLRALCNMVKKKGGSISGESLKNAVDEVLKEKSVIKEFIEEAKKEYKK